MSDIVAAYSKIKGSNAAGVSSSVVVVMNAKSASEVSMRLTRGCISIRIAVFDRKFLMCILFISVFPCVMIRSKNRTINRIGSTHHTSCSGRENFLIRFLCECFDSMHFANIGVVLSDVAFSKWVSQPIHKCVKHAYLTLRLVVLRDFGRVRMTL